MARFLTFFILPTFFIFKNVHWKYHLKSLSKQRKQIGSVWLFFVVPMLEFPYHTRPLLLLNMHGNHHHHHHHQRTDLGGIMSITSVFTIGPFVPCTPPPCKILNTPVMSICLVKQNDGTWVEKHQRFLFNVYKRFFFIFVTFLRFLTFFYFFSGTFFTSVVLPGVCLTVYIIV